MNWNDTITSKYANIHLWPKPIKTMNILSDPTYIYSHITLFIISSFPIHFHFAYSILIFT